MVHDGGIGKYGSLPCTSTAKITTEQNNYHSELSESGADGSLTSKELKKVTFSPMVEGVETW